MRKPPRLRQWNVALIFCITSGSIWLPIEFEGDRPVIRWRDQWDLSVFSK